MTDATSILPEAFRAAVASVQPGPLIRANVAIHNTEIRVGSECFPLPDNGRLLVAGAGKASGLMASELETLLGDRISGGAVAVKHGHTAPCRRVRLLEAGHPYPDQAGVEAAREIAELCCAAGKDDLILFLTSGGGSALLADCPPGIPLEEMTALSKLLVTSGADIREINTVRKHLSSLKGGQLARLAYPARIINLIISDVVGDPLDVIASGPTVPDPSTFAEALDVCHRYNITDRAPESLMRMLTEGAAGKLPETPGPEDHVFARVTNLVIGSNRLALEAAQDHLRAHGVTTEIVTDRLEGNTEDAAALIVRQTMAKQRQAALPRPYALIYGGETTLRVTGAGLGGRNQHLALKAAELLRCHNGICLLAAGTDGTDGPTDAAGAIVDSSTAAHGAAAGKDITASLAAFDSYTFFKAAGGHVHTGPTLTNVMDITMTLIN
jgi:glycerate 2-kinase